jgi:hypothetical protein
VDVDYHEYHGERLEILKKRYSEALANYLEEDCDEDVEVEERVGF